MYGNGRPSPITSGVRVGKTWRSKSLSSSRFSSAEADSAEMTPDLVLGEGRAQLALEAAADSLALLRDHLADARRAGRRR